MTQDMVRLLAAQAEQGALEEGLRNGTYVSRAKVEATMKRRLDRAVAKILAIPARLAAAAAPEDRERVREAAQRVIDAEMMALGPILDLKLPQFE